MIILLIDLTIFYRNIKAQVGIINLIFRDNVDFILRAKSCYMLIQCIIRLHFRKTQ